MPAKLAGGIRDACQAGRLHQTRTRLSSPASVDAPRPRKVSKRAAERFRGVGKLQNTPLNVSEASEGSKHAAEGFRGASGMPAKLAGGIRDACQVGRLHQTRTRLSSPASADAPRIGASEARAGAAATAASAAPRATARAAATAAAAPRTAFAVVVAIANG